jgi:hypothetical protein
MSVPPYADDPLALLPRAGRDRDRAAADAVPAPEERQ